MSVCLNLRHVHPDPWVDDHTVNRREPVDDLEPIEVEKDAYRKGYRDAADRFLSVMNAAFSHIKASFDRPGATVADVEVAYWQPAYACGLSVCRGKTMTKRSLGLGRKRATISKGATCFAAGNQISPSEYMKKEATRGKYKQARIESIQNANLSDNE